jgi:hypothetical protein
MAFLALNLLDSGVQLSMLCAVIGLIFAFVLIASERLSKLLRLALIR